MFLLDALAKQTKTDAFRNLQFTEFKGHVSIAQGVATLKDWIEHGNDQRISLEGTVGLDGRYELSFQPAVAKALAGKLSRSALAQQFMTDQQGYLTFPSQVVITGQGTNYQLGMRLPAGKEARQQMGQTLNGVLQGVMDQQLNKRDKKKRDNGEAAPAQPGGAPESTPALGGGSGKMDLGGIVEQQLKKRQEKEQKKKDKKKKNKDKKNKEKANDMEPAVEPAAPGQ